VDTCHDLRVSRSHSVTLLPPEGGVGQTQAWMPTYVSILRIPQMIWVWRATVEWYWQGRAKELGEKPVPVPLCTSQNPHGLIRARTLASAVRGRRLTTWAMAGHSVTLPWTSLFYVQFASWSSLKTIYHCPCSGPQLRYVCLHARTNALTHWWFSINSSLYFP
jgi:hypothetical protein